MNIVDDRFLLTGALNISAIQRLQDFAPLYLQIRKLAGIIMDHLNGVPGQIDLRNGRPLSYGHTANGLILEFYEGAPACIWSPWGKWQFRGATGGVSGETITSIMHRLKLRPAIPPPYCDEAGVLYEILAIDGDVLPLIAYMPQGQSPPLEECQLVWKHFAALYNES